MLRLLLLTRNYAYLFFNNSDSFPHLILLCCILYHTFVRNIVLTVVNLTDMFFIMHIKSIEKYANANYILHIQMIVEIDDTVAYYI